MISFTHHTLDTAPEQAQKTLENIKNNYGFIPNLFAYMAEAPTTIEAYLSLNTLVSQTSLTPAQQQIALLAASVENECEFCTVAHKAFGKMNKVNPQTIEAIVNGDALINEQEKALVKLTQSIVKKRCQLEPGELAEFIDAGFTKQQILEVILIVSIKTLSNYINHLTQPEPNKELLAMI